MQKGDREMIRQYGLAKDKAKLLALGLHVREFCYWKNYNKN